MQTFPEELVFMILVFGISDIRFYDVIHQLFNNNVNNNVADVFCVCKQWHRIGLVCLYDTIIIRSRAQALALATTLDKNPHLSSLIKNARIEGGYPQLNDIFKKCVNLNILILLLWDILLMEDMQPLCRALKVVNPVVFLFLDHPPDLDELRTQRRCDNFDLVHKTLCSAIPTWSRLVCLSFSFVSFADKPVPSRAVFEAAGTMNSLAHPGVIVYVATEYISPKPYPNHPPSE